MNSRKIKRRIVVLFIIVMIFALVPRWYIRHNTQTLIDSNQNLFELMAVFAEIAGALGLIYEFDNTKKIEEADFIVNLNQKYIEIPDFQKLIDWLEDNGYDKATAEEMEEKKDVAIKMLDFFEPFYILLNKKIIDIEVFDDLFGFRFFYVTNNKWIQEKVINNPKIDDNYKYYKNITNLHFKWEALRRSKGGKIPLEDTSMSKAVWYRENLSTENKKIASFIDRKNNGRNKKTGK